MFGHELPYVLSDCDGTISNSKLEVSEETRKSIIKYQHKSAYHFSFVSGRLGPCCKSLARELKVELPVVSCNGALISDLKTGEIFSADYLNQNLVCQIIDESVKAGIDPFVYTPTQMAGLVGNPRFLIWKAYRKNLSKKDHWPILEYETSADFQQAIKSGVIKPVQILLYAEKPAQQQAALELLKQYKKKFEGVQSLPFMFNLTKRGVDKLSGLKKWAKIVGVNYQKVLVFGDNYNDLSMLKGVKKSYVVGNGVEAAQKAATKIIEPMSENGVGLELERIIAKYD